MDENTQSGADSHATVRQEGSEPYSIRIRQGRLLGRLCTFLIGSGGGMPQHLAGYGVALAIAWVCTFASFRVLNVTLGVPDFSDRIDAIRALEVPEHLEIAADTPTSLPNTEDAAHGTTVSGVRLKMMHNKTVLGSVELVDVSDSGGTVVLAARLSSGPMSYNPAPYPLYERHNMRFLGASRLTPTHTIATPVSKQALDRALEGFFERLSKAAKESGSGDSKIELPGKQKLEKLKRDIQTLLDAEGVDLSGIMTAVSSSRRWNGPIQWSSVVVFWILFLQLLCRIYLHRRLESRIFAATRELWLPLAPGHLQPQGQATDLAEGEVRHRMNERMHKVRDAAAQVRKNTGLLGTQTKSAYLECYEAAATAFDVEGNYRSVPAFLDQRATNIADERAANLNFVKFLLWAIPTIGFIGTVLGIGNALAETVRVESLDIAESAIAKSIVSSNIGVAFDTTLVALLLSLVAMLAYHITVQMEELTIADAKENAARAFVFPGVETEPKDAAEAFVRSVVELSQGMRMKAAQLETTLHQIRGVAEELSDRFARPRFPPWLAVLVAVAICLGAVAGYAYGPQLMEAVFGAPPANGVG